MSWIYCLVSFICISFQSTDIPGIYKIHHFNYYQQNLVSNQKSKQRFYGIHKQVRFNFFAFVPNFNQDFLAFWKLSKEKNTRKRVVRSLNKVTGVIGVSPCKTSKSKSNRFSSYCYFIRVPKVSPEVITDVSLNNQNVPICRGSWWLRKMGHVYWQTQPLHTYS